MNPARRRLLRSILPEPGFRWVRRHFGWQWFRGEFGSWAEARAASTGYDDAAVLRRVVASVRQVHAGRALWERDGVAFIHPELNEPLLASLRQAAAENAGRLDLVDFGGSLGSTWWQHRTALADLAAVRWRVVEQPAYVAAGREFADATLSFHDSLEAAMAGAKPAVVLFSSVLPYVEDPLPLLAATARLGFPHVLLDRTPFVTGARPRLTVQHTPAALGGGSYPCWLFARDQLLAALAPVYAPLAEWPALDDLDPDVQHLGFHFRRRP